jgi:hypothetical protein
VSWRRQTPGEITSAPVNVAPWPLEPPAKNGSTPKMLKTA